MPMKFASEISRHKNRESLWKCQATRNATRSNHIGFFVSFSGAHFARLRCFQQTHITDCDNKCAAAQLRYSISTENLPKIPKKAHSNSDNWSRGELIDHHDKSNRSTFVSSDTWTRWCNVWFHFFLSPSFLVFRLKNTLILFLAVYCWFC